MKFEEAITQRDALNKQDLGSCPVRKEQCRRDCMLFQEAWVNPHEKNNTIDIHTVHGPFCKLGSS